MDVFEVIRKRRSVRHYTGDPIPREDLIQIVDAGRLAPSGSNRQPWEFIIVTEPAAIATLAKAGPWIKQAGAVIVLVMDPASQWWVEDGSAAVDNMLLAATGLGYGSCWVEGDAIPHESEFKTLLKVPDKKRVIFLVSIGVPRKWPVREKKPLEQVLHWEKYTA